MSFFQKLREAVTARKRKRTGSENAKKTRHLPERVAALCAASAMLAVFGPFAVAALVRYRSDTARAAAAEAAKLESLKLFRDAAERYIEAYDSGGASDPELLLLAAVCHRRLADRSSFVSDCERLIRDHPGFTAGYDELADYYSATGEYQAASYVIDAAFAAGAAGERTSSIRDEVDHVTVRRYTGADSIGDWHSYSDRRASSVYEKGGKYGVMTSDGTQVLKAEFDSAGVYDAQTRLCPATLDGEAFYVNAKGERVLALPEGTVYAGPFGDGLAPFSDGSVYRYCDAKGRIVAGVEFDYAGSFCNGAAAVSFNGKWGLVDTAMNSLTPLEYDCILTDENGFCFEYGTAVALKGGKWYFLDSSGAEKGPGFDGAELPASVTGLIAVKRGSLWGFADREGNIVIEPAYDGAGSFCHDTAPVLRDGRWGFIDGGGNQRTEFEYDSAGVFSAGGGSVVRKGNLLFLLTLAKFG